LTHVNSRVIWYAKGWIPESPDRLEDLRRVIAKQNERLVKDVTDKDVFKTMLALSWNCIHQSKEPLFEYVEQVMYFRKLAQGPEQVSDNIILEALLMPVMGLIIDKSELEPLTDEFVSEPQYSKESPIINAMRNFPIKKR
jgi:hypothetical protein